MKTKNKTLRGVTLVEIAIVLVIIGLLLGGILKGQELINNAKVRAIADRQNSLKVAWFAFIDRFQALPGDYVRAQETIPGAAGPIDTKTGNGTIGEGESPIALQNLTGAGYLRCPQCTYNGNAADGVRPRADNSLQNQYGGIMAVFHNVGGYAFRGSSATTRPRLMVHTGPRIPSNILAEVDRKLDDGVPTTGDFVFNQYDATGGGSIAAENKAISGYIGGGAGESLRCMSTKSDLTADANQLYDGDGDDSFVWRSPQANPPVENDCGASVNI